MPLRGCYFRVAGGLPAFRLIETPTSFHSFDDDGVDVALDLFDVFDTEDLN